MTRLEKLKKCLNELVPDVNEEQIKRLFVDCDTCLISDYCDDYFWLKESGEYLMDEDGDMIQNPDMDCDRIVNQWMHEEC